MSANLYVVETRNAQTAERGATDWHTDGIGDNEPRSLEECMGFIEWACSADCDWRRDAGAPHEYAARPVTDDGRPTGPRCGARRDDE